MKGILMHKKTTRILNQIPSIETGELTKSSILSNIFRKLFVQQNESVLSQFLRYLIVGGISAFIDIFIFTLGVNVLGINHIISNSISFVFGLVANYLLSRKWVFNQKVHNPGRDFFLFSVIGLIGLILSNILIYILIDLRVLYYLLASTSDNLIKPFAKLIVINIVLFWNFIARKKIVFST
jgi:putative flippase GtrA